MIFHTFWKLRFSFLRFLSRIMYVVLLNFLFCLSFDYRSSTNQISFFKGFLFRLRLKFLIFYVIFDSNETKLWMKSKVWTTSPVESTLTRFQNRVKLQCSSTISSNFFKTYGKLAQLITTASAQTISSFESTFFLWFRE